MDEYKLDPGGLSWSKDGKSMIFLDKKHYQDWVSASGGREDAPRRPWWLRILVWLGLVVRK